MLRLKPSELTLTPEDVEETLRRMARRRQQIGPTAPQELRSTRTSGRRPSPVYMPGAQRSVRDAIVDLSNIPVLRPQPQRAIIAHVDDESEDSDETLAEPAQRVESSLDPIAELAQPVQLASTSSTGGARLPFRLGRSRGRPETEHDASSSPKEQSDDSEDTLVERANAPTETTNVVGPATPSRRRASGESATDSSPTYQPGSSPTTSGLRGGASHYRRDRIRSIGQDALHAPSPLRQTQVPSPAQPSASESSGSDEEDTPIYLEGYFENKRNPDAEYTYTFRELFPRVPRTEPLQRTSQSRFHARSRSSNETPASRLFTQTTDTATTSTGGDVFWTAATPANEVPRNGTGDGSRRLHSSEISNTSLPYSYYELPETRQSSGEQSAQSSLMHSQYDGAASSRQASRGTYRSVRLPEARSCGNASSSVQPVASFPVQQGPSPLPTEPYMRSPWAGTGDGNGSAGDRLGATSHHRSEQTSQDEQGNPNTTDRHTYSDAVVAAMENRVSPLDTLTAQYGRVAQRLADQQGEVQRHGHLRNERRHHRSAVTGLSTHGLTPSGHAPLPASSLGGYGPSAAYGSSQNTSDPAANALAPPMAMADDPYTRGVSANVGRPHGMPHAARPVSAQPALSSGHALSPEARGTQAARSSQRSSENAPISSMFQGSVLRGPRDTWPTRVQEYVAYVEQTHYPTQSRYVLITPSCVKERAVRRWH